MTKKLLLKLQKKMPNEKFNKPTNKWITEEEEINKVVNTFDPVTKKLAQIEVIEKHPVKVMYEKTILDGMFCPDFTHVFHIIDSHKYIIKCKNCPLHKHISPGNEYIDQEGHVRLRSNDSVIA